MKNWKAAKKTNKTTKKYENKMKIGGYAKK